MLRKLCGRKKVSLRQSYSSSISSFDSKRIHARECGSCENEVPAFTQKSQTWRPRHIKRAGLRSQTRRKHDASGFRQGSGQKGDDQRAPSKVVYPYADVSIGTTSLDASKFSRGEHIGAHPRGGCNSPRMHISHAVLSSHTEGATLLACIGASSHSRRHMRSEQDDSLSRFWISSHSHSGREKRRRRLK